MPQLFQVLRCYKCLVFQVHQTKKSNKWECKICGEKQSVKRHYGLGTGKECRIHVQKLNGLRGDLDELKHDQDQDNDNSENESATPNNINDNQQTIRTSKWSNFIDDTEIIKEDSNENMTLGDAEVMLEIPKKRRKEFNHFKKKPKVITAANDNKIQEIYERDNALTDNIPIGTVNTISIQPKTSQIELNGGLIKPEIPNISRTTKTKFIPPVLNKNSKWAQYTDDVEVNEEIDIPASPCIETHTQQSKLLFSLCDDNDLDNILDI